VSVLVFIGPSGAGKTRIGKRVARLLRVPFTDTDSMVVHRYGPISQIFGEHGELYFRGLEREAVHAALEAEGVLSLGGGAVLDTETQAELAAHRVVFLTISPDAVQRRLSSGDRPLVPGGLADWIALNAPRWAIYGRLADLTIDTSGRPSDEIAEEVVAWART
jgi:shikimate kinase